MAKKQAAPKAAEPTTTEKKVASQPDAPLASNPDPAAITGDMLPADRAVLQEDIDTRMAALLKDHEDMGAR